MKTITWSVLLVAAVAVLYLGLAPVPIAPVAYHPPAAPGLVGPYAPNQSLAGADKLFLPEGADGPEDFAVLDDRIYTADVHGGLYRLKGDGFEKVAQLDGRPLGLDEGPDGAIYIANSFKGLQRWSPERGVELLVESIDGQPVIYPNQVAVASDGTVYFSNSSDRFDPELLGGTSPTSVMTIVEQSNTGYVARRTPDGKVSKVIEGFVYTNGLALSENEDFLLIAETGRARIHRFWLKGPREGQSEVFLDNLPGYPDNLESGSNGSFWVAYASPRAAFEKLLPYPFLRKVFWRLGPAVRPAPVVYGMVAQYDREGRLMQQMQDPEGATGITTDARVIGGALYIGLLEGPYAVRLPLDELP